MSTTPQVPVGVPDGRPGGPPGSLPSPAPADSGPGVDEFAERLFASSLGAIEVFGVYLGDRLGWYRSLATDGPATSSELAARTGTQERYAREWLEGQAVAGILAVVPGRVPSGVPGDDASARRYALPPGPYAPPGQYAPPPRNTSTIVLTVLSGVATVLCCLLGVPSLVLGVLALTRQSTDPTSAARLTRSGWITFAVLLSLGVVAVVVLGILRSTGDPTPADFEGL